MNICLQAGKLGLDPVEVLLRPSHVDVGLGPQPARPAHLESQDRLLYHHHHLQHHHHHLHLRPAHLLGEGATVHLGGLKVASIQNLKGVFEKKAFVSRKDSNETKSS